MSKTLLREGFWYSKHEPKLPMPIPLEKSWKGKKEFLENLKKKEGKSKTTHYKGWSTCRLCGCHNGSTEFSSGGWVWPEGYAHYVKEHNVRPSLAFQEFICGPIEGR